MTVTTPATSQRPESESIANPRIVPIIIPEEKLKKQRLFSLKQRGYFQTERLHRISGACLVCRSIPDYMVIYDYDVASKIERYCSACLDKEKESK